MAQAVTAVATGGIGAAVVAETGAATPELTITAYRFDVDTDKIAKYMYPGSEPERSQNAYALSLRWPVASQWDMRLRLDNTRAGDDSGYIRSSVDGPGKYSHRALDSRMAVDYEVMDFEAGYHLQLGGQAVRLFGGLRYTDLKQDSGFRWAYRYENTMTDTVINDYDGYAAEHRLKGFGLRLGAETAVELGRGWSLSGLLAGHALQGKRRSDFFQTGGFGLGNDSQSGRWYGVDGELAVNWRPSLSCGSPLVAVGYSYSVLYDAVDLAVTSQAWNNFGLSSFGESDLRRQGWFLRLGWGF